MWRSGGVSSPELFEPGLDGARPCRALDALGRIAEATARLLEDLCSGAQCFGREYFYSISI